MTSSSTALHTNGAPCGVNSKPTEETNMNSSVDDRKNTNWPNVLFYIYLHLSALYAIILIFRDAYWFTIGLAFLICLIAPYGVTVGAHRLWAHSAYKASLPLRLLLCFLHTLNAQGSVYDWVLEHRLHHKLRGTPQDPYNPKRGFFFAHINNRFKKRTEEQLKLETEIDMSDLEQDSIVMFQKQFYWILMPILSFLLPVNAPVEYWGESILTSVCVVGLLRHVILLHAAWLVYSGPVLWGLKDGQNEADSNLVFLVRKSRWHEYHYMLPWDYRTNEYGSYGDDVATHLIEFAQRQGWASGLRTCSDEAMARALDLAMDLKIPLRESVERVVEQNSS